MYCVTEKEREYFKPIQGVNTDVTDMGHSSTSHHDEHEGMATDLNIAKVMIDKGNARIFDRAQEGTNKISKLKGNKLSVAINEILFTNKKLKDYSAHAIVITELPQVKQTLYRKFFLNLNGKLSEKYLFPGVALIETPGGDIEKYKIVDKELFMESIEASYLNKKVYPQKDRLDIYDGADKESLEKSLTEHPIPLHPAMKARIEAHIAESNGEFPTQAGIVGLHAEVQALNFVFHKLDELGIDHREGLKNTYIYTKRLVGEKNADFPACYNCSGILSGDEHVMTGRIHDTVTGNLAGDRSIVTELPSEVELKTERNDNDLPGSDISLSSLLTTGKSPIAVLESVYRLVEVAVDHPSKVAKEITEGKISELLAKLTEKGGMSFVVDAWTSLLQLLYKDGHMGEQDIINSLLPRRAHDSTKSLLYAMTGAKWSSDAVVRICALLSEVSKKEGCRAEIIRRLSMKQSGYEFAYHFLSQPADFFKLAKRGDELNKNDQAKHLLKESHLVPTNRELYEKSSRNIVNQRISGETNYASLLNTIKNTTQPATLVAYGKMQKDSAELEKAKTSTKQALDEFNAREKEENERRTNEMIASFDAHFDTQAALHDSSRQQKESEYARAQVLTALRQREKIPSFKGYISNVPENLFVASGNGKDAKNSLADVTTDELEARYFNLRLLDAPDLVNIYRGRVTTDELEARYFNLRLQDAPDLVGHRSPGKKTLAPPLLKD